MLSILCVTRAEEHAFYFLEGFIELGEKLSAEVVFLADGQTAYERLHPYEAERKHVRVIPVKSKGFIESVLEIGVEECKGDYILRLDDDEYPSDLMIRWLQDREYETTDHWKFPRAHLWPDTKHFITDPPLWPDHQTRLSVKAKAGGRHTIHAGSPFGGGKLADVCIEHHKFLVKSEEQRLRIGKRYDSIMPGAGLSGNMKVFQLPELAHVHVAPMAEAEILDTERCYVAAMEVGMHQHHGELRPFADWLATRRPHHVVEIGTLKGGTSVLWHCIATGLVVSVDLPNGRFGGKDHGYTVEACEARNQELQHRFPRFHGVLGNSHDEVTFEAVRAILNDEPVDFLFIDGDHSYFGVKQDFEMYSRLVRKGGIIAFHDILDTPLHRAAGCQVHMLWQQLPPHKAEFSIKADWGGIGVTFKS